MADIIIKFDLDSIDDRVKIAHMLDGESMFHAINGYYDAVFRNMMKHEDLNDDEYQMAERLRDALASHFEEFLDE